MRKTSMNERFFIPAPSNEALPDSSLKEVSESQQLEWLGVHPDEYCIAKDTVDDFTVSTHFNGMAYDDEVVIYLTHVVALGLLNRPWLVTVSADYREEALRNHAEQLAKVRNGDYSRLVSRIPHVSPSWVFRGHHRFYRTEE
jgi:hypothetical protein